MTRVNSVLRLNIDTAGPEPTRLSEVRGITRHGHVRRRRGLRRGHDRDSTHGTLTTVDARDARVHRHAHRRHEDIPSRCSLLYRLPRPLRVAKTLRCSTWPRRTGRGDARGRGPPGGDAADGKSCVDHGRLMDDSRALLTRGPASRSTTAHVDRSRQSLGRNRTAIMIGGSARPGARLGRTIRPAVRPPRTSRPEAYSAAVRVRHMRLRRVTAARALRFMFVSDGPDVVGRDRRFLHEERRRSGWQTPEHRMVDALARDHRRRAPGRGRLRAGRAPDQCLDRQESWRRRHDGPASLCAGRPVDQRRQLCSSCADKVLGAW